MTKYECLAHLFFGDIVQEETSQWVQKWAIGDEWVAAGDDVHDPFGSTLALGIEEVVVAIDGIREGRNIGRPAQASQRIVHKRRIVTVPRA